VLLVLLLLLLLFFLCNGWSVVRVRRWNIAQGWCMDERTRPAAGRRRRAQYARRTLSQCQTITPKAKPCKRRYFQHANPCNTAACCAK
jgi:hypothetical protein